MDMSIRERRGSWTAEYDISVPGANYFAKQHFALFNEQLDLLQDKSPIAKLKSRFSFFRQHYIFEFADGHLYEFWREKAWKGFYICAGGGEEFELYAHKGLRWSIFTNQQQIAAFTKNRIVFGRSNQYNICLNHDANAMVIACMVLALNTSDYEDNQTSIMIDFGNLGPEARSFDESWKPG
ncbi:MAG TPA: hypothetical protein VN684_06800 [Terriglobales bacterium]|nr:hypothetical protein [Terriglobales bacterium]